MPTLGQALAEYREHLFVGRTAELVVLERWLDESAVPPSILNVSGIGGSGKTELLQAFRRRLTQLGIPVHYLDGRSVRASQADLAAALEPLRHVPPVAHGRPSTVLLIDTYEEIGAHDRWFRDTFLSQLDSSVRVVLAGRFPVDRLWMASGGWAQLVRSLAVGPLSESDAREYLRRRGIDDEALSSQIWSFTRGHPLALCLATDMALRLGVRGFAATPERYLILQDLFERLLDEVENRQLRELLVSAAMVRQFDEAMLAALIGMDQLGDTFDQLCRLSIVRPAAHGLAVHDTVRRALTNELRWRNPGRYAELRSRALAFYSSRFRGATPDDRHWLVADWLSFSTRALIQHLMFEEVEPGEIIVESATRDDDSAIHRLRTERATGQASLGQTGEDDPSGVDDVLWSPATRLMVARNWDGDVMGYSAAVPICRATVPLLLRDPALAIALRTRLDADDLADLPESGQTADTYVLWHLVPGRAAPPSVRSALIRDWIGLIARGKQYLVLTALPDHQAFLATFGFRPIPEVSFDVNQGGQPLRGLALDLRAVGPERWVEAVLNGGIPADNTSDLSIDLQPAVQDALSHWSDDTLLAASPLLRSVASSEGDLPRNRAKAVRDIVCKAFRDALEVASEADHDVLRALELAYLQRSTSHERLAERLAVSRSTLYRMLHRGCRLVAARIADHA